MAVGVLVRPRLVRRVQTALRSGHLCIEAPGGYGKTTLLRALLTQYANTYYYHDLIREFLLSLAAGPLTPIYERAARWFAHQGDWEQAIEHALLGRLYPLAQQLLLDIPTRFVRAQGRMLTYRRWVLSLPEATLSTTPILLVRLGHALFQVAAYTQEAQHLPISTVHPLPIYADSQCVVIYTRCKVTGRRWRTRCRRWRQSVANFDYAGWLCNPPEVCRWHWL